MRLPYKASTRKIINFSSPQLSKLEITPMHFRLEDTNQKFSTVKPC
jgi:hypothetical protein